MKNALKTVFGSLVISCLFFACSSPARYIDIPSNKFIRQLSSNETYTIVLHDMDVEGSKFKHQYQVIHQNDSIIKDSVTAWHEVSESYFFKNEDNLGMALVTKQEDGTLNKIPAPAGFDNYVGNEKYGEWKQESNGSSFWSFYGRYMFISHLFGYNRYPVFYNSHRGYMGSYRGRQPYYGSSTSSRSYGTKSSMMQSKNPSFFSRKASNTGWAKSSSSYRASKISGSGTSKYKSNTTTRGFGGGFGK